MLTTSDYSHMLLCSHRAAGIGFIVSKQLQQTRCYQHIEAIVSKFFERGGMLNVRRLVIPVMGFRGFAQTGSWNFITFSQPTLNLT